MTDETRFALPPSQWGFYRQWNPGCHPLPPLGRTVPLALSEHHP